MYDDKYRNRFDKVPAASSSCTITATDSRYPRDHNGNIIFTHIHNHKDFEMIMIRNGNCIFKIDNTLFRASKGDIILINPYQIHGATAFWDTLPFSSYCFTFDLSLLCSVPTHPITSLCEKLWSNEVKFSNLISKNNEMYRIFQSLETLFSKKTETWEIFFSSLLLEFFGIAVQSGYCYTTDFVTKNTLFVKRIQEYIEKNFTSNIRTTDAAKALSYDKSYFCRLFKKNFGQSFSGYLNFHRITYARELLNNGSSVAHAATASGFNNLSHFTRTFKKFYHTLPSKCTSPPII